MFRAALCGVAIGLVLLSPAPAHAINDVIVDGTTATAEREGDGLTASVTLFNVAATDVDLPGTITVSDSCEVTLEPTRLPGLQSTKVALDLGSGCFTEVDSVRFDLDSTGSLPPVTVREPEQVESDWAPLVPAALVALLIAVLVMGAGEHKRRTVASSQAGKTAKRLADYETVREAVNSRLGEFVPPVEVSWKEDQDVETPTTFSLTDEVRGLEAGWSFSDSWASNLTVATAAVVALGTSVDALTALVGEEPKAALGVMTVAGLISAALVGLANTVVKLFGPSVSAVSVIGLMLSTGLVVFAASFETLAIGLIGADLLAERGYFAIALTVAFLAALLTYGIRSLRHALAKGPDAGVPDLPPDALEAWAGAADWQRRVVELTIKTYYADWLDPDSTTTTQIIRGYPGGGTSTGDSYTASLI